MEAMKMRGDGSETATTMMVQICRAAVGRMTTIVLNIDFDNVVSRGFIPVQCGRGDKRTKKGKRFESYRKSKPKKDHMIERIND